MMKVTTSVTTQNSRDSVLKVPFSDFASAHAEIREEVMAAIGRVLESSHYILGEELALFEEELASWLGVKHAVGVACGTDALVLAMWSMGVRPGDEVLTTDMAAIPTVAAIEQTGAVPVLVDIDSTTGLLDVDLLESVVTAKTRGIIAVHLYGRSCDMTSVLATAEAYGLWVIEDCAQSIGACHAGGMTGSSGACGAFSFYRRRTWERMEMPGPWCARMTDWPNGFVAFGTTGCADQVIGWIMG